jgi:hypothetical protein
LCEVPQNRGMVPPAAGVHDVIHAGSAASGPLGACFAVRMASQALGPRAAAASGLP